MRFCGVLMALLALASPALTQPAASPPADPQDASHKKEVFLGFVDANRDGINDRFRDAEGDGRDDVSGTPYPHRFAFADQNQDGSNDLFVDRDGDGVNDLNAECGQSEDRGCAELCSRVSRVFLREVCNSYQAKPPSAAISTPARAARYPGRKGVGLRAGERGRTKV